MPGRPLCAAGKWMDQVKYTGSQPGVYSGLVAAAGWSGVFSESATELAGAVFVADIKFNVGTGRKGLISTEGVRRPSL